LMLALPGGAYVYQGEELGLPEVEDIPDELLQDPVFRQSEGADRGRDGCRVPLPWSGQAPPFGFSPATAQSKPWLPQPPDWAALTVEAQQRDPGSTLSLYRDALRLRREHAALGDGALTWTTPAGDPDVLDFVREPDFRCITNLSSRPVPLQSGYAVLLASEPLGDNALPPETSVWLVRQDGIRS
jgi:alpha-glucosidase